MPQMSPYNWLFMFMYFNIIMMFIISFINYIKLPIFKKKITYKKIMYIWKW